MRKYFENRYEFMKNLPKEYYSVFKQIDTIAECGTNLKMEIDKEKAKLIIRYFAKLTDKLDILYEIIKENLDPNKIKESFGIEIDEFMNFIGRGDR